MATPRAPSHLSSEAKRWWRRISAEYAIDDEAGQLLLQTAMESFDRMRACQAEIECDGQTVIDRFDQAKPHPLLATERDARGQMLAAIGKLNLDIEPLRDRPGRPGGR